jgi:hypothetical protein
MEQASLGSRSNHGWRWSELLNGLDPHLEGVYTPQCLISNAPLLGIGFWGGRDMLLRAPGRIPRDFAFPDCAILSLLITLSLITNPALAQPGSCDPLIKPSSLDSTYSYRQRNDRCEGVYAREVAADILMVASLTQAFDDFTPNADGHLHLSWDLQRPLPVRLSAFSLRPHFYYRMDSTRPPGASAYDWPTDVLAGLHLSKVELGVVATVSLPVGGAAQDVYLPLRIGAPVAMRQARAVQLILVSDVELSEVYVSMMLIGTDGQPVRTIRKNEALGYGDYPAQGGIPIILTDLGVAGLYQIDIGATLVSGGSANLRFRLYKGGE